MMAKINHKSESLESTEDQEQERKCIEYNEENYIEYDEVTCCDGAINLEAGKSYCYKNKELDTSGITSTTEKEAPKKITVLKILKKIESGHKFFLKIDCGGNKQFLSHQDFVDKYINPFSDKILTKIEKETTA